MQTVEERFLDGRYKKLLLVAHPDDEAISASFFLQRQRNAYVAFATNGGFTTPERLQQLGLTHLSNYASTRTQEALDALRFVAPIEKHFLGFPDGALAFHLAELYIQLAIVVKEFRPEFILTHALERHHADHDACSFVAARLGQASKIPVWEMPLYHMNQQGRIVSQEFRDSGVTSTCLLVEPTAAETAIKGKMLASHRTQATLNVFEDLGVNPSKSERFRVQPMYDYHSPQNTLPIVAIKFREFDTSRSVSEIKLEK